MPVHGAASTRSEPKVVRETEKCLLSLSCLSYIPTAFLSSGGEEELGTGQNSRKRTQVLEIPLVGDAHPT